MELPPFLLDHWLSAYDFAQPSIALNLASSTGPRWTIQEIDAEGLEQLNFEATVLSYAPPEGGRELREAIGDYQQVDPETVIATMGSSEALSILLCLHARAGGNIVVPNPGYPAYAAMAKAWDLTSRCYTLSPKVGFAQEADAILAATNAATVAVIVNTPHNPSGSVMARGEIERLARALKPRDIPLIVDEVCHPLYFGQVQRSTAGLDGVIVTGDLSKAFSLPGLRIGWIVDYNAARRRRIVDARSYFTVSGSPLTERVAALALRDRKRILSSLERVATKNLARLDDMMAAVRDVLSWTRPEGGTTCFAWLRDGRDSRPFCQALANDGVLVAPGDCFGHPAHFRVGFAQQNVGFDIAVGIVRERLLIQPTHERSTEL